MKGQGGLGGKSSGTINDQDGNTIMFTGASLSMAKLTSLIRHFDNSLLNRLRSIAEDAQWLERLRLALPNIPIYGNLRCGVWYVPPDAPKCYFKSADGHCHYWTQSLSRLNLHIAIAAASTALQPMTETTSSPASSTPPSSTWTWKNVSSFPRLPFIANSSYTPLPNVKPDLFPVGLRGVIIVDSTRKGKRFPDSFSRTIPIWACAMNRAIALYLLSSQTPITDFVTSLAPPSSTSPSSSPSIPLPTTPSFTIAQCFTQWLTDSSHPPLQLTPPNTLSSTQLSLLLSKGWDAYLHLPPWVSPVEIAQIEAILPKFTSAILNGAGPRMKQVASTYFTATLTPCVSSTPSPSPTSSISTSPTTSPSLSINVTWQILTGGLRAAWLQRTTLMKDLEVASALAKGLSPTSSSTPPSSSSSTVSNPASTSLSSSSIPPIIKPTMLLLYSCSRVVPPNDTDDRASWSYVQGAADDEEMWAGSLTSSLFYRNMTALTTVGDAEECWDVVGDLLEQEKEKGGNVSPTEESKVDEQGVKDDNGVDSKPKFTIINITGSSSLGTPSLPRLRLVLLPFTQEAVTAALRSSSSSSSTSSSSSSIAPHTFLFASEDMPSLWLPSSSSATSPLHTTPDDDNTDANEESSNEAGERDGDDRINKLLTLFDPKHRECISPVVSSILSPLSSPSSTPLDSSSSLPSDTLTTTHPTLSLLTHWMPGPRQVGKQRFSIYNILSPILGLALNLVNATSSSSSSDISDPPMLYISSPSASVSCAIATGLLLTLCQTPQGGWSTVPSDQPLVLELDTERTKAMVKGINEQKDRLAILHCLLEGKPIPESNLSSSTTPTPARRTAPSTPIKEDESKETDVFNVSTPWTNLQDHPYVPPYTSLWNIAREYTDVDYRTEKGGSEANPEGSTNGDMNEEGEAKSQAKTENRKKLGTKGCGETKITQDDIKRVMVDVVSKMTIYDTHEGTSVSQKITSFTDDPTPNRGLLRQINMYFLMVDPSKR